MRSGQVQMWRFSFRPIVNGMQYKVHTWFEGMGQERAISKALERVLTGDPIMLAPAIYGEMSSYQTQPNYHRYHLDICSLSHH